MCVAEVVFAKLPGTGWSCRQGVCARAPRILDYFILQPHQLQRSVSAPPRMKEKQVGCEEESRIVHR